MRQINDDEVVSILDLFVELDDPRSTINRKHLLGDLIVICICAVIANADGPKAIGVWAKSNADWLRQHLELPQGIPSHDTIGRLLAALKPAVSFRQACNCRKDTLCQETLARHNMLNPRLPYAVVDGRLTQRVVEIDDDSSVQGQRQITRNSGNGRRQQHSDVNLAGIKAPFA